MKPLLSQNNWYDITDTMELIGDYQDKYNVFRDKECVHKSSLSKLEVLKECVKLGQLEWTLIAKLTTFSRVSDSDFHAGP
jgi:hypothetical protein